MYQNAIYICISWYNKVTDFQWKNIDASRTQGVSQVIYMVSASSFREL